MDQEKQLSERESIELIAQMINKAKNSYYDTGIGAIMWGSVIAICSLVMFSQLQWNYRLPFDIYLLTLVAIIPQVFLTIKEKKERKVKSYDETAMDFIWLGFGISIFLLIHVNFGIAREMNALRTEYQTLTGQGPSFLYYDYVSSLFLILYGLPTFITGGMCKFRPMFWGGIFCWVCSVICVYTHVKIDLILTALSAIFAWLIPGIIMEKEYRIFKKEEQAKLNV